VPGESVPGAPEPERIFFPADYPPGVTQINAWGGDVIHGIDELGFIANFHYSGFLDCGEKMITMVKKRKSSSRERRLAMGLKEAYQEKLEAQLKEWSARVKLMQAKAEVAKADAKIEMQKHLQTLQAKQEAAQQKLKELKDAGADAWEKAKPGLESAWESVKKHFA
jgi:hypothetical protein